MQLNGAVKNIYFVYRVSAELIFMFIWSTAGVLRTEVALLLRFLLSTPHRKPELPKRSVSLQLALSFHGLTVSASLVVSLFCRDRVVDFRLHKCSIVSSD